MKVEFFKHNIGKEELEGIRRVFNSPFLTTGKAVDRFEADLANYLGTDLAVGLTSCTGALHLALIAAGVKRGDEVITTPMSFVATSNAIMMAGAKPVFVDVEKETGNINANLIEDAITKKTRAILPVHLYGQMADMKKILAIAKKHKLVVIEDAAHALEAGRDGIRPGADSFGACFSFYATKSITSGEGGAFATRRPEAATLVKQLRSHGITSEVAQRHRTGLKSYDVDRLGWKYNMANIQAAMLIPQLKKADVRRDRRAKIAEYFRKAFSKMGVDMPRVLPRSRHAHHLFPIWVPAKNRDDVLNYLNEHGIGAAINYPPIHLFSLYRKKFGLKEGDFPVAENIGRRTISLPLYSKLTDSEVKYVIRQVKNTITKA